jgi:FtsZ-interacting cell division protein ZipA
MLWWILGGIVVVWFLLSGILTERDKHDTMYGLNPEQRARKQKDMDEGVAYMNSDEYKELVRINDEKQKAKREARR